MPRLAALVEQRLVTNKDVVTELERFNITTVEEILFVSPEAVAEMTKISQEVPLGALHPLVSRIVPAEVAAFN